MFPAIRERLRAFRQNFGGDPITLGLKDCELFGFNPLLSLEQAKLNRIRGALDGSGPSWAGENVTNTTSLNLSVNWACRRIISESVAFMPLSMMQEKNGEKAEATGHPLYAALHDQPNDEMSDMEFRETLTDQVVSGGNSFAYVQRRSGGGPAIGFQPIPPGAVRIDRDSLLRLVYIVKDGNAQEKSFTVQPNKPQDILHIRGLGCNGVWGFSVLAMARQSMGAALAADHYAGRFYAAGGRVPYVIEMAQKFRNDEDFRKWRSDWNQFYANSDNWHQAAVMEPGMKYQQIGLSPEDAQFLETRQYNIPEICRWYLISPHMVGDLSRATFSNIENLALQFVKFTLTAWITRWEKALRRCALTPDEKTQGYYFHHNVDGLLRGDFAARMAGYASALQNGHLSINEVRDLEDRNPIEGGDQHFVQLNMRDITDDSATTPAPAPAPMPARVPVNGIQATPKP